MKEFLIFVFVVSFLSLGDSRKVCILLEQKSVFTTTTVSDQVNVTINEVRSSDVQEDLVEITVGAVPEVTEDASSVTANTETADVSAITVEAITEAAINVSLASNVTESTTSTNACALEGITLFDDQTDLLRKMCAIKTSSSSLYVVTVQNSVVKSDLSLATLCSEGPKGLLSWISWDDFIDKVKPFLNADELPSLVVRNSSIGGPSDALSEVLIEMLPISYKLVNMKPSAWNNNTFIKTVSLGNFELENANSTAQHIEGELNYSFPIETNITFLSGYPISGLPVEWTEDESDGRKNFIVGSGTSYQFNNTFSVERLVPAFKKEAISLTGTFGLHEHDITGQIVSIFGLNADGSTIEESHTISARVVSSKTYDLKDTYNLEDYTTTTTTTEEATSTTAEELPIAIPRVDGPVYPGFKKFFYVAVFLVLATFIIAAVDIGRKLRQDCIAKKQGTRSYRKVIPRL